MKRALVLLVIVACSNASAPPPEENLDGPVAFRVLSERENASFCHEAPDFSVAKTEEDWIDVFDVQTECNPGGGDVPLPKVNFDDEAGVAAWWKRVGCLGFGIKTRAVERRGADVIVTATSKQPGEVCATAIGQLESFLALSRSDRFDGTQRVVFMLDGEQAGIANGPRAS